MCILYCISESWGDLMIVACEEEGPPLSLSTDFDTDFMFLMDLVNMECSFHLHLIVYYTVL